MNNLIEFLRRHELYCFYSSIVCKVSLLSPPLVCSFEPLPGHYQSVYFFSVYNRSVPTLEFQLWSDLTWVNLGKIQDGGEGKCIYHGVSQ